MSAEAYWQLPNGSIGSGGVRVIGEPERAWRRGLFLPEQTVSSTEGGHMMRLVAGMVFSAFLVVFACDTQAKTVTYYFAKVGTKLRKGPGQQYPVIYTTKEIDAIMRVGKTKLYGRQMTSGVEGKPKCKAGWCEVMAGAGRFGFIPQSALQTKTYTPGNYDEETACYIFDDC